MTSILPEPYQSKTFLTPREVAMILNQSYPRTLESMHRGEIPGAFRLGLKWRVLRIKFEEAIAARAAAGGD